MPDTYWMRTAAASAPITSATTSSRAARPRSPCPYPASAWCRGRAFCSRGGDVLQALQGPQKHHGHCILA